MTGAQRRGRGSLPARLRPRVGRHGQPAWQAQSAAEVGAGSGGGRAGASPPSANVEGTGRAGRPNYSRRAAPPPSPACPSRRAASLPMSNSFSPRSATTLDVRFLVEQGRPASFECGKHRLPLMPRGSSSVATACRRGSGGGGAGVEPLQRLAPPGQPDRAKRRLGRRRSPPRPAHRRWRTVRRRRAGARPASNAGRDRGPSVQR